MVKCIWILGKPNSYLYVVLTSLVGLNYILVQVMNAFIFGIGNFVLTRRVIEQPAGDDTLPKLPILRKVASLMKPKEKRR